jgi:electron transfer flavoprotein alpha subunit
VEELVARLLEHGLFGTWRAPVAGAADASSAAVSARAGGRDVLVVAELLGGALRPVTFELLGAARTLAVRLGGAVWALLAGHEVAAHTSVLAAHGAVRVFVADDPALAVPQTEPLSTLLAEVIIAQRPGIVLLGSTVVGRDVAPRVAARLDLGLTGDCIDLSIDAEGRLLQHKPAFGGRVVAPIVSRTRPEMATVRPGMLAAGAAQAGRPAEIARLVLRDGTSRVTVLDRRRVAAEAAALDDAEVVVGVGTGLGGAQNLGVVRGLAAVLDAALCTTRDVTDKGWLPKQFQVGLTGRAIAPRLYIAVGIRGAFEHLVGVRRAGVIVAINKNAKAPIFKAADYGLVGDYAVFVPLLTERLGAARAAAGRP